MGLVYRDSLIVISFYIYPLSYLCCWGGDSKNRDDSSPRNYRGYSLSLDHSPHICYGDLSDLFNPENASQAIIAPRLGRFWKPAVPGRFQASLNED